jgi:hypothetical protein
LEWLHDGFGDFEWEVWKESVERVGFSLVG